MTYKEVTANSNDILTGVTAGRRIRALLLVAGIDAATATVYDNTAQSGNKVATLKALANDSKPMTIPGDMGLDLKVGLSVTLAGTSPVLYVYYD